MEARRQDSRVTLYQPSQKSSWRPTRCNRLLRLQKVELQPPHKELREWHGKACQSSWKSATSIVAMLRSSSSFVPYILTACSPRTVKCRSKCLCQWFFHVPHRKTEVVCSSDGLPMTVVQDGTVSSSHHGFLCLIAKIVMETAFPDPRCLSNFWILSTNGGVCPEHRQITRYAQGPRQMLLQQARVIVIVLRHVQR